MKIHLEKGQILRDDSSLIVYASGDYEENELVDVADISNPDEIKYRYEAKYILNGGEVYQ